MFLYWYKDKNDRCLYVGITKRRIEERFFEHINVHKQNFMSEVTHVYGLECKITDRQLMEYIEQVAIRVLEPTQNKAVRSFKECYYGVKALQNKYDPAAMAVRIDAVIEFVEEAKGGEEGAYYGIVTKIKKGGSDVCRLEKGNRKHCKGERKK